MLAQTVVCPNPTCRTPLRLKAGSRPGATAPCPRCGTPVLLAPLAPTAPTQPPPAQPNPPSDTDATAADRTRSAPSRGQNPATEFPFLSPPQQPDELGRLGTYRVLEELGRGGMGVVFRAQDTHLRRIVALKVMLPPYASDPTDRARFVREARAQAAVEHDHVAAIYQVSEANGAPFLAMPLLKGQSLADALRVNAEVPLGEAVRIAREMAEGLAAAHERGLVHRDIKPGNVWLEHKTRRVKILDFGLARPVGAEAPPALGPAPPTLDLSGADITRRGAVIGTPAYMSPEQARGEPVDGRGDLFSLGVVLYQLLAGRQPFRAPSTTGVLIAVAVEQPHPPSIHNLRVTSELDALTLDLLAKTPDERPPSAEYVAQVLRAIEAGLGATAQNPGPLVAIPTTLPAPGAPADPWRAIDDTQAVPADELPVVVNPPTIRHAPLRGPKPRPANRRKLYLIAGLSALALVALVSATTYALSGAGTVTVEVADEADAKFRGGKLVLSGPDGKVRYTLSHTERNKKIGTGTYTARLEGADGLRLEPGEFALKRGDKVSVYVSAVPKKKEPEPKKEPVVSDPERRAARYVVSAGGTVRLNDAPKEFKTLEELPPAGEFRLTEINLRNSTKVADADLAGLRECKNLRAVNLANTGATDAALEHFKDHEALAALDLRGTKVTEKAVRELAAAQPFCEIEWAGGKIAALPDRAAARAVLALGGSVRVDGAARDLRAATDLPKQAFRLTSANLFKIPATDTGLAALKGCKHLSVVSLSRTGVGDGLLECLADSRDALTELRLGATAVTDKGLEHLKGCTGLRVLYLYETEVTDKGLAHFAGCTGLVELYLYRTKVSDTGLAHFAGCTKLARLELGHTRVSDAGLAYFKDCKGLTALDVCSNNKRVTNAGLTYFRDCKGLTSLHLCGSDISDEGLSLFKDCAQLTELRLARTPITDDALVPFRGLERVTIVDLSSTRAGDTTLDVIKDFELLTTLSLDNTPVTDTGLMKLKGCKNLTLLSVTKNGTITAAAIDALHAALPNCEIVWDKGTLGPKSK